MHGSSNQAKVSSAFFSGVWASIIVVLFALLIRLPGLNKSLNADEIYSVRLASKNVSALVEETLIRDYHPPLYYLFLKIWIQASRKEAWLRLLSVGFGAGLAFLAYRIGKEFAGNTFGFAVGLLMAFSPSAVVVSQLSRSYACQALLVNLSLFWLMRAIRNDSPMDWTKHTAVTVLAIYTFYFSLLAVLLNNLAVLFIHPKRHQLRPWFVSQAAVLFLFLPLVPIFLQQAGVVNRVAALDAQIITFSTAVKNLLYIFLTYLPGIDYRLVLPPIPIVKTVWPLVLFGLTLRFAVPFLRRNPLATRLCIVHIFGLFGLTLILQRLNLIFVHRFYFAYIVPWVLILILAGIFEIGRKRRWAYAAAGIVFASNLMGLATLYATPSEDFRAATAYIDRRANDGDLVCTVADFIADCYRYYSKRDLKVVGLPRDIPGIEKDMTLYDEKATTRLSDLFNKHSAVWMIYSHEKRGPVDRGKGRVRQILFQSGYQVCGKMTRQFPGVKVELFRKLHK